MTNLEASQGTPLPDHWARNFFTTWAGQVFSLVGSALVQFALVWWMTSTTGSATVLATATLVVMLPQIFLGPFTGALIDRWNRKIVMIVADGAIAASTLALIGLFAAGKETLAAVYFILLIRSLGGSFHYPAMTASTSLMVPREQLARIAGLNQTLNGIITIIAPPLGALLVGILPMHGVLMIDVGTAAIAISILFFVVIPRPPRQVAQSSGSQGKTSYWQDLRAGWTYMISWPGLLAIALLAMLVNFLLTPSGSLIPLVVTKEYHGGAPQLGLVDSLMGVGVIIGGVLLSAWGGFKKRIITSMAGIIGIGAGIILFGCLPTNLFGLALAGAFLVGFAQVMANGPLMAILQASVDADMQGRVLSLINAGATAMSPLSLLIAGPVSDWLGVRSWYYTGGIICILAAVAALFIPVIMKVEENRQVKPVEVEVKQPG